VLGNKVYVAQAPKMLVYTIDASGDKPVGPPEVLFDGFGGVNSDHGLHSIMLGPDGRFYFNAGNSGCDGSRIVNGKGEAIVDSAAARSAARDRSGAAARAAARPALLAGHGVPLQPRRHGLRDARPQLPEQLRSRRPTPTGPLGSRTTTTTAIQGVRINYVMEGGNFGYVGAKGSDWARDQATHPGQTRQEAHWHQRDPGVVPNLLMTGGGSPCGICVYEGDLLPEPFRGALLHADAGPNVVRAYMPTPAGAGYTCASTDFLKSSYNWVRPVDVCVGVDGAVFVADWTDSGVGGHATGDIDPATISGRIYRIAPTGNKPVVPALDLSTAKGQTEALCSPNLARRFLGFPEARRRRGRLRRRPDGALEINEPALPRAGALDPRPLPEGRATLKQALQDADVNLRVTALRAARQNKLDMIEIARRCSPTRTPSWRGSSASRWPTSRPRRRSRSWSRWPTRSSRSCPPRSSRRRTSPSRSGAAGARTSTLVPGGARHRLHGPREGSPRGLAEGREDEGLQGRGGSGLAPQPLDGISYRPGGAFRTDPWRRRTR
jgi:hypothetical protein